MWVLLFFPIRLLILGCKWQFHPRMDLITSATNMVMNALFVGGITCFLAWGHRGQKVQLYNPKMKLSFREKNIGGEFSACQSGISH